MLDGNSGPLLGQEVELNIPKITIRLDQVRFDWKLAPNGDGAFQILYPHPMFPVIIEVPFDQVFFMEKTADSFTEWARRAREIKEETA